MDGIDLVTDRRNLRLLLGFVDNNKKPFLINLETVESTLLFSTWSPKNFNFVQGFAGYGHEYEKSSTRKPHHIRNSIIHNRIIRYTLGTVRLILRFEVDACMPSSIKNNRTRSIQTPTGITVISTGDAVASSRIVEIKTGRAGKQLNNSKTLSQMWFSQTPILCTGHYCSDGNFMPPTVTNVEKNGKLARWEVMNQDSIRKLIRVLELIMQTLNDFPQTKCAIVHEGDGVLKFYSMKDSGSKVSNELSYETIPLGRVEVLPDGTRKQRHQHDFYNCAGLARSIWLYSVPDAFVEYSVTTNRPGCAASVQISLLDEQESVVVTNSGAQDRLCVQSPRLWQPGSAYLYQLRVSLLNGDGQITDIYDLPIGIRKVAVNGSQFLINNKPFYFKGFGKHEDTPIRGKGFDPVYMVHDFQLMKWTGANSFRTAHYPYAEEILAYADRHGIVIINETAAVGLNLAMVAGLYGTNVPPTFSPETISEKTRQAHEQSIRELIQRDKNHACVVMWTIANEPASSEHGAREYFKPLVSLARQIDPTRPICYANFMFCTHETDKIGDLQTAEVALEKDLRAWAATYNNPIIISEYGADAQAGLHAVSDTPWSEEYQVRFLEMYHRVHDRVDAVVGEHVWNFADFQTSLQVFRVDGNKKGVFTRDRRPKAAAFALRERWTGLRY
ncbi:glycosyl hydrolases family 2, TIM barrel domain-containing protein [Aspergillus californicus]